MNSIIVGSGGFLPQRVVTNDQLSKTLETSHEWIVARTGICQRHLADPDQKTSDMAFIAAQRALHAASMTPEEVDVIIVATSTADHVFPPCATRVQMLLGAHRAVAFDMNAACSGFLFAMTVADAYIKQGVFRCALIIGADTLSRIVDWEDRGTAILFGDGAGALVMRASTEENRGILHAHLYTDGAFYDQLYVCDKSQKITMNGREVFRHAVQQLETASQTVLDEAGFTPSDVDWVVPHQANKRIIDAVMERMGVPLEKALYAGDKHANTSAASIPLVLWKAMEEGRVKTGDLLLFQAFGAGFTWGALVARL